MYKDHKLIVVTPAGRQRYMEVLLLFILKNRHVIDEYHIWLNTQVESDIQYLRGLATQYPDFIKIKEYTDPEKARTNPKLIGDCHNIRYFFQYCIEPNTVYIRLDDDIVYVEDGFFENLSEFRISNPDYFIVFPLIINNVGISVILRDKGLLPEWGKDVGKFSPGHDMEFQRGGYHPLDGLAWADPHFAWFLHHWFLTLLKQDQLHTIKFDKVELSDHQYVSINSICWLGSDFAKFNGIVDHDNEEGWMNLWQPQKLGKINAVCGNCIVSHFAFYVQRKYLDSSNILDEYRKYSKL